jgi:hypothetical protein
MKKRTIISLCLLLGISFAAQAQQLRFGIRGGLNIASIDDYNVMQVPEDDEEADLNSRLGAYAGVVMQYLFDDHWGIESGLYYTQLGGKLDRTAAPVCKVTASPSYLQLPIQVLYRFPIGQSGFSIYPAVGIYLAYGLGGKVKMEGNTEGFYIPKTYDYFGEAKRFDAGAALGVNFEYRGFVLTAGYDMGFLTVGKNVLNDNARNSAARISLAYLF